MTCKDCIHQTACLNWCRGFGEEAKLCEHFSDKAEWVHLPDKDYKTAYYALGYGKGAVLIEEPIYGLAIKNGKHYVIDECKDLYEIGENVFLTKEKAEKALELRRKKNEL
jgi:hypothetical protein